MSDTHSAVSTDSLTDTQAIRALHLFYELSPPAAWEGARKPSPERLKTLAAALAEEVPFEFQTALSALLDEDSENGLSARAALARSVLRQAANSPGFAPAATQAIQTAARPEMAIDPVTAGLVLALVIGMSHIKAGSFEYESKFPEVIQALRLPELLSKLPAVLKAVPAALWSKLTGK